MRTRKHQSPVESGWVEKLKGEDGGSPVCETQLTPATMGLDTANGVAQSEFTENHPSVEQKKLNGKRQKRRRRSPKNKSPLPNVDSALVGLMTEPVWLDKWVYDEAECAHHVRIAQQATVPVTWPLMKRTSKKQKNVEETSGKAAMENCCRQSITACHHVSNGVWINKCNFDDAERRFVMQFTSPLAPRALHLNLASLEPGIPRSMQRTPDEGYASATPTPAAQDLLLLPTAASDPTVNGKPHWAGLHDLVSEVWLQKSSYDQAERHFYEHVANGQSALQAEPNLGWGLNSRKKNKRDKWNRKYAARQLPSRKKLSSIPEEAANALYYPAYFLHADSETVWLDKTAYDKAEACFYAARGYRLPCAATSNKSSVAKLHRPTKSRQCDKKMAASFLSTEKIWFDKYKYDDAERQFYEQLSGTSPQNAHDLPQLRTVLHSPKEAPASPPQAHSGPCTSTAAAPTNSEDHGEILSRVSSLERENQSLHKVVKDLQLAISKLESRIVTLEKSSTSEASVPGKPFVCKRPAPVPASPCQSKKTEEEEEEDDDDIDLFGSDEEEDERAAKIKEERIRQYSEKKSKKPVLIAKSSILLDVKPWDDETDMAKLEECVRTVQMDGLLWGSAKLVPVGYGIKKLQIQCVVEDDKVGTDTLEEEITKFEDYVQSVDIAAFNKV
ncbi:elongation factor 1-delta isoform X3 [Pseudophryne corroboree]|uniref:elongation factor 1-delta isoform X3 n=1 Tax=Pseudophryne corroboree TaxID=495146 RepID=UPI0030812448